MLDIQNDRRTPDEPDAWKWRWTGPGIASTWSPPFDTFDECQRDALAYAGHHFRVPNVVRVNRESVTWKSIGVHETVPHSGARCRPTNVWRTYIDRYDVRRTIPEPDGDV